MNLLNTEAAVTSRPEIVSLGQNFKTIYSTIPSSTQKQQFIEEAYVDHLELTVLPEAILSNSLQLNQSEPPWNSNSLQKCGGKLAEQFSWCASDFIISPLLQCSLVKYV